MQKIINYCGEKFILSGETAKHFKDDTNIANILKIPHSDNCQIELNNKNGVYFGTCKKYVEDNKIKKYYYTENGTQLEIEKMILDNLSEAYSLFTELDTPYLNEIEDFKKGIQQCEYVIGMRYARKKRPDLFSEK
jgi:hypothetical protein